MAVEGVEELPSLPINALGRHGDWLGGLLQLFLLLQSGAAVLVYCRQGAPELLELAREIIFRVVAFSAEAFQDHAGLCCIRAVST